MFNMWESFHHYNLICVCLFQVRNSSLAQYCLYYFPLSSAVIFQSACQGTLVCHGNLGEVNLLIGSLGMWAPGGQCGLPCQWAKKRLVSLDSFTHCQCAVIWKSLKITHLVERKISASQVLIALILIRAVIGHSVLELNIIVSSE